MILTSDPHLTANRPKLQRKHKVLSKSAQGLLLITDDYLLEVDDTERENFAFVDMSVFHGSDSDNE